MYIVKGKVLSTIFDTTYAPLYLVYFGNVMCVVMDLVAVGFVMVKAIDAAVSFSNGFFYNYTSNYSGLVGQILTLEFVVFFLYVFWSLLVTLFTFLGAGTVWDGLNARIAEVEANHTGLETPLQWSQAIKALTLCMLIGIATLISGYALGEVADHLIEFFASYDDKETNEADKKTDSSDEYPDGTSAQNDLLYHLIIDIYGWLQLSVITIGSHIFHLAFFSLDDGFTCEIDAAHDYSSALSTLSNMKTKEQCLTLIADAFKLVDVNGDGVISRCEDASFQVAAGSTKEYALKYSTTWTPASS